MQKTFSKTMIMIIRLAVMAGFYFLAVRYSNLAQQAAQIITVALDGGGLSAAEARKIAEAQNASGVQDVAETENASGERNVSVAQNEPEVQNTPEAQEVSGAENAAEGQKLSEAQSAVKMQNVPEAQTGPGVQNTPEAQDIREICLWTERPDALFSCRETGRQAQAAALFTEGNPELAAPGTALLLWEKDGCFVDTATAEELFGTRHASGQLVWYEERAYKVYGTFESLRRTVVLGGTAGTGEEVSFDMLSLRLRKGEGAKAGAEQLMMQYELSGEIMDFTFPGILTGDLLLLLPLFLAAGLIRTLWHCMWSAPPKQAHGGDKKGSALPGQAYGGDEKESALPGQVHGGDEKESAPSEQVNGGVGRMAACAVLLAAVIAAVYFMLRNYLEIPADMIPTRWSDFSFWSAWWKSQRGNLLRILGSAQGEMHLMMLWNLGLSVICNILAVSFYCITPENTL